MEASVANLGALTIRLTAWWEILDQEHFLLLIFDLDTGAILSASVESHADWLESGG